MQSMVSVVGWLFSFSDYETIEGLKFWILLVTRGSIYPVSYLSNIDNFEIIDELVAKTTQNISQIIKEPNLYKNTNCLASSLPGSI